MKKWIDNLIEKLTSPRESEVILGDMYEEYNARVKTLGKLRADALYIFDFVSLLLHKALKKKSTQRSNSLAMFINYLKVAFRQLGRQKLHNMINITGLALGLAVTFVITLYVAGELSYDQFHSKKDRICLLPMTWKFGTTQISVFSTTPGAGPIMKELFNKEIESYVRTQHLNMIFEGAHGPISENMVKAADSTFFEIFTFPLAAGNEKEALREPNSIVLTEKAAAKYFGEDWKTKDLLGKTMTEQSGRIYKITAIAKDVPATSHIQFDALISMTSLPKKQWEPNWDGSSMVTYVLLDPNALAAQIVAEIPKRTADKYGAEMNDHVELDLVPLTDVYLRNSKYTDVVTSDIRYIYVFSAIAMMVLVIAIINYMNLSTARSLERAREVGVRKVVGAVRLELFWQFISESIMVTFAAMVIAVLISYTLLPIFNNISAKALELDFLGNPERIGILVIIWLTIAFLGGAYPATILSSFRPATVLKGIAGGIASGSWLRKSLVVFQFAVSIFLIVCTLTINDQLSFMVNKDIGVDKEQLVFVPLDSAGEQNIRVLQNEFNTIAGVEKTTSTSASPVNAGAKTTVRDGDIGDRQLLIFNLGVTSGFVDATGLELIAGTDLSPDVPKDSTWEYLLNESAVEFFGWTNETAVGKQMNMWNTKGVVKGVVRDFHFLPLRAPIEPLLIHAGIGNEGYLNKILVRIDKNNFAGITAAMEERWRKVIPDSPFNVVDVNDLYRNVLYRSETKLSRIMNVFSILAIVIAGLGLFGLASYTISRRTKELGIRKVLGAPLSKLVVVVSSNFMLLVIVAFVIAAPLSWYAMTTWLTNFAYPVGFNWIIVMGSGILAVLVAAGTVMYHAIEAARVNPVNTLRSE